MRFALDDLEQRGFDYVMSASAGHVTVLNSLAMGWKTLGPMEPVTRMKTQTSRTFLAQHAVPGRARRLFERASRTIHRRLHRRGLSFSQLDQAQGPLSNDPEATITVSRSPDPASLAALAARIPG